MNIKRRLQIIISRSEDLLKRNIAIIGGGASGLVAAITAARNGAIVTIYERLDRVLKKLLATGNGRCNMTNINADIENYHGNNPKFINSIMNNFWISDTLDFFSEIGILSKIENDGKVYPYSLQASSVSDVLRLEAEKLKIKTVCNFEASEIIKKNDGYTILSFDGKKVFADAVIISAGGKASPNLGSNGSGYLLAKKLGHTVTELYPALVQVKTDTTYTKALQGLKINARASFYENEKFYKESTGEVLFTDYGLSGPPIFDISRLASTSKNGKILLDIMPEYSEEEILSILTLRKSNERTLENYFVGMLPKKLGQVLLKSCGISPLSAPSNILKDSELIQISKRIKSWVFDVEGTMSWNNAQVTAGGVSTAEINPKTLESRLFKNIYFTGELLDIDGDCGGFNLQWAWSSGYIAGLNASRGGHIIDKDK